MAIKPARAIKPINHACEILGADLISECGYSDAILLSATPNTNAAYTVPTGAKLMRLTCKDPFWFRYTSSTAVPAASTATGNAPMLCVFPMVIEVPAGVTSINFVSATASALINVESWT
jgi:hypothetical protein